MSAIDTVRLALPVEAVDIARIQRRSWTQDGLLSAATAEVGADEATRAWHDAIVKPPLAHMRILVAIGDVGVVGFAVTGPSADEDQPERVGQIAEFVVDPKHRRRGHGSRLMNAAVDTLRQDGYLVASMWVAAANDLLRGFLTSSGWGPDGAHREIGSDSGMARLKIVRLVSDIS